MSHLSILDSSSVCQAQHGHLDIDYPCALVKAKKDKQLSHFLILAITVLSCRPRRPTVLLPPSSVPGLQESSKEVAWAPWLHSVFFQEYLKVEVCFNKREGGRGSYSIDTLSTELER